MEPEFGLKQEQIKLMGVSDSAATTVGVKQPV